MTPGTQVTVNRGRLEGETGRIVRKDEVAPFYFITLDRYSGIAAYRSHEFGPFAASELTVNPEAP